MVLAGVIFANVPMLNGMLSLFCSWGDIIRQLSFIMCLIRCGIGMNHEALRKSWVCFLFNNNYFELF